MKKPSQHFGSLEMKVIGLIEAEHPASVRQVLEGLTEQGSDLAYTTVMTICMRLWKKNLLTRKKVGKRFMYEPAKRFGKARKDFLKAVQTNLFQGDMGAAIVGLIRSHRGFEEEELQEIIRACRDRLRSSQ
jgi:predicted transcriptional regulator